MKTFLHGAATDEYHEVKHKVVNEAISKVDWFYIQDAFDTIEAYTIKVGKLWWYVDIHDSVHPLEFTEKLNDVRLITLDAAVKLLAGRKPHWIRSPK